MRQTRQWMALAAAGVMAVSSAFPVFAASTGPGASAEPERYDAETKARLQDNVIEYDEIQNLIHEYNPTISEGWRMYEDTKEDYANMVTELESQYPHVKDTADGLISQGEALGSMGGEMGAMGAGLVETGKGLDSGYRGTIQGLRDTVNKWDTNKQATKQLRQGEKQMTAGAQSAMIGFEKIRQNIATLETMVQMYEKQVQIAERQSALGLGTESTLLSAKSSLLSAQTQMTSLASQMDSVRRTLCQLLGFDPDTNPEIRPIPEFDMSRLDTMDLEQDTVKAIGNNYTLIGQRTSASGKTSSQIENRNRIIDEGDQKLTIEMQRLYRDVMDKKAAYEAAVTGYTAAEKSREASERMYANGMLSEAQYIGTQISYCQKKAAKESANLDLWQAMETYVWAIDGQAKVE